MGQRVEQVTMDLDYEPSRMEFYRMREAEIAEERACVAAFQAGNGDWWCCELDKADHEGPHAAPSVGAVEAGERGPIVADGYEIERRGNPQDVLISLPDTAEERKGVPIGSGVLDYFPLAVAYVAKVSKAGNDQHNPGQPLHWARGKSTDHWDCVVRHGLERGTFDTDGLRHTGKLVWRAMALLQEELEQAAGFVPGGA